MQLQCGIPSSAFRDVRTFSNYAMDKSFSLIFFICAQVNQVGNLNIAHAAITQSLFADMLRITTKAYDPGNRNS